MPKTSDMREHKFLKKEDVGGGTLLTITGCKQFNVAMQGAEPEHKWCLVFQEADKPLVLNATNIQLCEQMFSSDDTDHWIGKKIVAYTDPSVAYQGKLIGGIRVRAPKQKAVPAPPPPATETLTDEDIPFAWLLPLVLPLTAVGAALLS